MIHDIIPTAEPFYFPGDETGILLVHGFTGAPKEMRWMGEYVAARGHSVLGVRLAGHATHVTDLPHTRWEDWLSSVEDGYQLLRGVTRRVYIMGLSMGGILSLLAASRLPFAGVVTMSTPYQLSSDPRLPLLRWIYWLIPKIAKGPPDWHNPEAARDHIDYPYYPTRSILELTELAVEMRNALPGVKVPALLVHSHRDTSVPPENMPQLYEHLGSVDKQMVWVENSGHVIPREPEREKVFEAAWEFVQRVNQHAA